MANILISSAWVLAAMLHLQPTAKWRDSYERTSLAIAYQANLRPLALPSAIAAASPREAQRESPRWTASVLVALAYHESRFDPHAIGDQGKSLGAFQIQPRTAMVSRTTLVDIDLAVPVALSLIRDSFRRCQKLPWDEGLSQYAAGVTCDNARAMAQSRTRLHLARRLYLILSEEVSDNPHNNRGERQASSP